MQTIPPKFPHLQWNHLDWELCCEISWFISKQAAINVTSWQKCVLHRSTRFLFRPSILISQFVKFPHEKRERNPSITLPEMDGNHIHNTGYNLNNKRTVLYVERSCIKYSKSGRLSDVFSFHSMQQHGCDMKPKPNQRRDLWRWSTLYRTILSCIDESFHNERFTFHWLMYALLGLYPDQPHAEC